MRRVVVMVAAVVAVTAAPAAAQTTITDGHVDYAARVLDGQLRSQIKDARGGTPVYREVADAVIALGPAARETVPAGAQPPSMGKAGDPVWLIPQVQKPGVPWLGWNTEAITGQQASGAVRWSLVELSGPGVLTVFQSGTFGGADVLFDSSDGLPDHRDIPRGVHAHGTWAFTRTGTYDATFEHRLERADGAGTQTDRRTLRFTVTDTTPGTGPSPTDPASPDTSTPPSGGSGGTSSGSAPGTHGATSAPGSGPAGTDGTSGGGASGTVGRAPGVRVRSASVRGQVLRLDLSLTRRSRVSISVTRAGRRTAKVKPRTVAAGRRPLRVRLDRRLSARLHTLTVRATAGGRTTTRTLRVRGGRR